MKLKLTLTLLVFQLIIFNLFADEADNNRHNTEYTFSSNLPIIKIDTLGEEIQDENRITVEFSAIYNEDGSPNNSDSSPNHFVGKAQIEIRGSSSQAYPKKQYSFETQDEEGENLNFPLLGLPEENDWILYASYNDKSFLRNVLVHRLFREMGNYSSRTKFCELFINDEYMGIYILMEKIKRDQNRVDIAKLEDDDNDGDDLTGGYIIKIDKLTGDNNGGWRSELSSIFYQYHYPKPDMITDAQKSYIQNYITDFENILLDSDYNHPETGYPSCLDMQSMIRLYLLNELSKNIDGYRLSTYMYKDKDSNDPNMHLGPIWDYDRSFGGCITYDCTSPEGWIITQPTLMEYLPFWMKKIWDDPGYMQQFNYTWNYYRQTLLSDTNLEYLIDIFVDELAEAQVRNFEKWPILDEEVYPYPEDVTGAYPEHVDYLKDWLFARAAWIDSQTDYESTETVSVCINEFITDQDKIFADSNDEYDDWIELYNYSDKPIDLNGMYFSDDLNNPAKFQILADDVNNMVLQPGDYQIFWADNQPEQGGNHLNFKLSSDGERLGLFDLDGKTCIDYIFYNQQCENISMGRIPDGSSNWAFIDTPTPGKANISGGTAKVESVSYPNPFNTTTHIMFNLPQPTRVKLQIYNIKGQLVKDLICKEYETGEHTVDWNGKDSNRKAVASGVYFYRLKMNKKSIIKKMLLIK